MFNDALNKVSEKVIEDMFLKLLEDFDNDDLQNAVDNNISLLLLTQEHRPKLLRTASGLAGRFRGQGHFLNIDGVLGWLEQNRKGFWLKIMLDNKKGEWLKRQIDDFRHFLFGM